MALLNPFYPEILNGKLETANHCKLSLEHDIPGRDIVEKLRNLYRSVNAGGIDDCDEQTLRVQGFEIDGRVHMNTTTGSKVNMKQTNFIAERILPAMQAVYGDETLNKCAIIIGYYEGVDRMNEALIKIRYANKDLNAKMLPIVQTTDSSQGTQAEWVCYISTVASGQSLSDLAFQKDNNRINVAITRAMHILTVVHGALEGGTAFDVASLDLPPVGGRAVAPTPLLHILVKSMIQDDLSTKYKQ